MCQEAARHKQTGTHTHTHTDVPSGCELPADSRSTTRVSEQYCLELYHPGGQKIKACKTESKGRVVQGKHQSYKLSAAGADERDSWIDAIR